MEQSKTVQIWVGVFVLIGIVSLWVLAMKVSNISTFTNAQGYELTMDFSNIGGLKVRSPVHGGRGDWPGFANQFG